MLEEMQQVGRDLFLQQAISSHGGNLSIRQGDRIFITRRGAMIHNLKERDIIETGLNEPDSGILLASTELRVHREIYRKTTALAVLHAHPIHAVALSLRRNEIRPVDSEGLHLLSRVPVLEAEETIGSDQVMEKVSLGLQEYRIVMLRGHGSFAAGRMLEEAYQLTSALEVSARLINILNSTGGEPGEI